MALKRAQTTDVLIRVVIEAPVPGVLHSLQTPKNEPTDAKRSTDGTPLAFECLIRVGDGPSFGGPFVRREGPTRRFMYIAIGQQAGDHASTWSRRMKIDLHDVPPKLLAQGKAGATLVAVVGGTGKDGTPACATVPRLHPWRALTEE